MELQFYSCIVVPRYPYVISCIGRTFIDDDTSDLTLS